MWRLLLLCASTYACSLCPLRVPPRPRPLDQFKLPSIPDLNLETMPQFCNFSRQLDVEKNCRKGFEKLFCATDDTLDSLVCHGQTGNQKRCSECAYKWEQSKWAISWWDSLGKPAAGVSDGNYYWLGDYELCSQLRKFQGNFSRQLDVEKNCRKGFEKLFCATDDTLDSLVCHGQTGNQKRCSECAYKWEQSKWAISWWDSLGKPAAGVSDGNYYWLGDYELCSQLRKDKKFDGQYCRIELEIPDALVEEGCPQTDPLAIVLGACLPRSCTDDQLYHLIQ
ncbi:unnamed protein product, partial [Strongylus vulgaris]